MRLPGIRVVGGVAAILVLAAGGARADSIHLYSYDPADVTTRQAAGPLTFTFKKGLFHTTVLNLRSTEATATAFVRPADDKALGRNARAAAAAGDLYEVEGVDDGAALISAFCPGASRAWMVFGPLRLNRDLTVLVVGAPKAGGPAALCRTLKFSFHGEWVLPPGRAFDPRDLEHRRYPGG